jgi:hypothetical protein
MLRTLRTGPDGPLVERDREQQVEQVGDLARVAARALLDAAPTARSSSPATR